jgi:nitroreductase
MDVYESAIRRRSIRRYQDRPVPYEILEKCVEAARLAPTGHNRQVWEFLVVDDEKLLPGIFDNIGVWGALETPGEPPDVRRGPRAYIFFLINNTLESELRIGHTTPYDIAMAAENSMLVAQENGVGSCPVRIMKKGALKQLLKIPDSHEIELIVALGYADEHPVTEVSSGAVDCWVDSQGLRHVPKRKLKDITHRNRFSR